MITRNTKLINELNSSFGTTYQYECELCENETLKEVKEYIMLNADINEFGDVDLFAYSIDGTRQKIGKVIEYKDQTSFIKNDDIYNLYKNSEVENVKMFQLFNNVSFEVTIKK